MSSEASASCRDRGHGAYRCTVTMRSDPIEPDWASEQRVSSPLAPVVRMVYIGHRELPQGSGEPCQSLAVLVGRVTRGAFERLVGVDDFVPGLTLKKQAHWSDDNHVCFATMSAYL